MRGEPRLTCSLALDNALPSWITPNSRTGFLSLGLTDMRTLDFTPSDSVFPIKLPSLHSYGTFGVLPWQLLSGTPYPSLSKNLSSILPSLARFQLAALYPTAQAGGLYGDFCNIQTQLHLHEAKRHEAKQHV